jgi:GNAT superfamily N-acetyltransferase
MNQLAIERVRGRAIEPYLGALAELRIEVFREYPYLYEGTREYEERYLRGYAEDERSVVVIARRGETPVGASTALPLLSHSEELAPVLARAGYDPATIYYFGESVLLPGERGQGIGHRFFAEREDAARAFGFARTCFCAVERSAGHSACPPSYVPHDAFWSGRGYVKRPDIVTTFSWRDLGQHEESPKQMVFWLKELSA